MIEKLTVEQFREIKRQLAFLIKQGEDLYEQHKNDENYNYAEDEKRLVEQYLEIQNKLLSCDLSDVPYSEWINIEILSNEDHIADFSKTNANIDFSMLEYSPYANYKSCKIQNIGKIKRIIDSDYFDQDVIKSNPSIFLSESFPISIKKKFYDRQLSMEDLFSLSIDQVKELESKQFMNSFEHNTEELINKIGLQKAMELYATSPDDYKVVYEISALFSGRFLIPDADNDFEEELKKADVSHIKDVYYSYMRKVLFKSHKKYNHIKLDILPKLFIKENSDILLTDENIPDDLRQRYYTGRLTVDDIINNITLFKSIPISNVTDDHDCERLAYDLGDERLKQYIEVLPELMRYIIKGHLSSEFASFVTGSEELLNIESNENIRQNITLFFASFNQIINRNQLELYNPSLFPLESKQQKVIETLGLDNIKRFEKETLFFSSNGSESLKMLDAFSAYFSNHNLEELFDKYGLDFKNGTLSYEEFLNQLAKCLDIIRGNNLFAIFPNYDWMQGEFRNNHPEIFVNFENLNNLSPEEKQRLTVAFYSGKLTFDDVRKYPELIAILKDKNLLFTFDNKSDAYINGINFQNYNSKIYSDLELLKTFGNEKFLELCAKYGRYMGGIVTYLSKEMTFRNGQNNDFDIQHYLEKLSFEEFSKLIEKIIIDESLLGNVNYQPEDAPLFLKESHPELFLSDDAPEDLKNYFYSRDCHYMTFGILQKHKEWLPFLKGKLLTTSLLRNSDLRKDLPLFINAFGEEKAIKLGISRAETVSEMLRYHQVDLMKKWYDKTGGKFIPDFVVMQNFSLEEADKFLISGSNWSNLMKIKSFAQKPESRAAMLKLAYSFGVFDQDQRGFKRLRDLLTDLPRKIDSEYGFILDRIDEEIERYSSKYLFYSDDNPDKEHSFEQMLTYVKNKRSGILDFGVPLVDFLEALKLENVDVDFSKDIFKQLYKKNDDGSFTLAINPQSCPKVSQMVRNVLEVYQNLPILTPAKAHQLFGKFELKYDADFREFLLANMDKILQKPENASLMASIQKQFSDIKTINANRALTWELAASYVQINKFTSVNVGNEKVAEVCAIAEYNQDDFNVLQQIYNYGKQRTFSSIPRIENKVEKKSGRYTYEMLRLDDPFAMAIGTLSDCCQKLNDHAEVSMEHSMVDKNGRVFVIKDEQGKIVAQSWVWRNKDVLCFDNIEIPVRAFDRAVKEHPELGRKGFTDEVYEVYKQAAHELIEADEKVYKELLESGKITQEQYDGLRLGKITVGSGWNDVAESLKQNAPVDKGTLARPLPFEEPVKLSRELYTADSVVQYILEQREDRKDFEGETPSVHNDTFIEYNDSNFKEQQLFTLEKLETVTKERSEYLQTTVSNYVDKEKPVSEIARNHGLNPETARIVMNPNFAIIYDVNDYRLRIGNLLFNTKVDNGNQQMDIENQVVMQIRLALEQIASNKEIDVSALDKKQIEIYNKATGLTDEMDIERGVNHAR